MTHKPLRLRRPSKTEKKVMKRVAARTGGTVFQHVGTSYASKFHRSLGKFGAASDVRRIDPITGKMMETK